MYEPTLLNCFPSISSQLQTLGDKKKRQILIRTCFKRGSPSKSGPLDFTTKIFPSFFVGEEALVGIY